MNVRSLFRQHLVFYLFLGLSLIVAGCGGGSDSYDSPDTAANTPTGGAATNVLVEPATVKSWIDQGLVNSEDPFKQRVVIIDFGADPTADPLPTHIQGACLAGTSALTLERPDGLAPHTPLVATGEQMDELIRTFGIDEDSIIVFTTSGSPYLATRAYWTFRYWGFPKEQLKLVNGGNDALAAAYPELMTQESTGEATPSTFSVRDLGGVNTELRASMGEFIQIIQDLPSPDSNDVVIDARGDSYYFGNNSTSALIADGKVVVDGHPVGGEYLSYKDLLNGDNTYKTAAEIRALFETKGWEPGKKVTVYCTSAYSATPLFFALDAILDTPAQLHDGSWSQTGLYSDRADAGGQLPLGSSWAIDDYLEVASYNAFISEPLTIESLLNYDAAEEADAPFTGDVPADDSDVNPAANDVEVADAAAVGTGTTVTFPAPAATATPSVLIEPATLESWINAGLVNAPLGAERVVILDVDHADAPNYSAGHIPGAQHLDRTQHVMNRLEGPAEAVNMVVTPERMDTLLSQHGIDENTTIVITTSLGATYFPSRTYFLFRYYGWPKDRIKVLNGYNGAWTSTGRDLTTDEPTVPTSSFDVAQIPALNDDLRVSLPELMDALRDGRGMAVDFRGDATEAGSTSGVFGESGDYVVFEGRLNGGMSFPFSEFNVDYGNDFRFKSAPEIRAALNDEGIFNSEGPIYSYCRTGYIASTGFFVLDAILNWDVMTYDGSWSQWGKLSADADKGGELPAGSEWAVDNGTYMEVINYNVDNTVDVAPLNPDPALLNLAPGAAGTNQVEEEDTTYQQEAGAGDDDGAAGPPAPGDSPAIGC